MSNAVIETTTEQSAKYEMKVSRLTIDKLGIKLYDRVTAVLAELIANSYDANASEVAVTLPFDTFLAPTDADPKFPTYTVEIKDNGHGMTAEEVNSAYLMVGSDRRERTKSDRSRDGKRPVMGRKGIGKLAPFGICRSIEVLTAGGQANEDGFEVSHLILRLDRILLDTDNTYEPEIGSLDGTRSDTSGTTITLSDFHRKRVPKKDELDRQLAARFGLQQPDWEVKICDANAIDPLSGEASFVVGELKIDVLDGTKIDLSSRPVPFNGSTLPVRGWVAYSKRPYKDPAMAGVRIYARGKIVSQTRDFNISSGFTGEFKLRSYLVGSIDADWLDEKEDLVRSDRQDIIWSSELGEALTDWGQALVKELAQRGENSVSKATWDEFLVASDLDTRLSKDAPADKLFRDAVKDAAKMLVDKKDRAAVEDPDHVERIVKLAYSLGPHRSLLEALRAASENVDTTLATVIDLFDHARIAEMYSLGQIAQERVEVLTTLEKLVNDGSTLEGPLQALIEQAPWLLAPEWTPLGMNESLKRVRSAFEGWYKKKHGVDLVTSAINRPRKEPDFVLLHDAGELSIVEIKRMDYHLTDKEFENALNYLEDLEEFLNGNAEIGSQFPVRRLTFVVDHLDRLRSTSSSSLKNDTRINRRTWHDLLDSTKRAHKDFLAQIDDLKRVSST